MPTFEVTPDANLLAKVHHGLGTEDVTVLGHAHDGTDRPVPMWHVIGPDDLDVLITPDTTHVTIEPDPTDHPTPGGHGA